MQSLRAELAELENDGDTSFQPDSPNNSLSVPRPELARAAHFMEERQIADILGSPPEELDAAL